MEILLAHLVGDYLLQSDWMAQKKTKDALPAIAHAFLYTLCYLPITQVSWALTLIFVSHLFIDHYRLARYVCWLKNFLAPSVTFTPTKFGPHLHPEPTMGQPMQPDVQEGIRENWWHPWNECSATGYHKDKPMWLAVWLMIIADNTLHLLCNVLVLKWATGQ